MIDITVQIEKSTFELAKAKAEREKSTIDQKFQEWLISYVGQDDKIISDFDWSQFNDIDLSGTKYTREELNEG